jgi:outer membrane murein-binding lipoprotein Lpp
MNNRYFWMGGSSAAVAAAIVSWLALAGAASGDKITKYVNDELTLSSAGKTDMLAIASSNLTGINTAKLVKLQLESGTKNDAEGNQVPTLYVKGFEQDCGTFAEGQDKSVAAFSYIELSTTETEVCWLAMFVNPEVSGGNIAAVEAFVESRLDIADSATFVASTCKENVTVPGQFDCTSSEVKTLNAQEQAQNALRIIEVVGVVP